MVRTPSLGFLSGSPDGAFYRLAGRYIGAALCACAVALLAPPALAQASTPWGVYLCQTATLDIAADPAAIVMQYQYPAAPPPPAANPGCVTTATQMSSIQNNYDTGSQQGKGPNYSDTGEVTLSGSATMGTLSASLLANVTSAGGQGSAGGTESLGWIDTFTIAPTTLPNGTPVTLNITVTYSGKIVPQSVGPTYVYLQFLSGDGATPVPIDIASPGIQLYSLDTANTSTATLQVHVGDVFQLGARMNAQVNSSEGDSGFEATIGPADGSSSSPDFFFTVNIDPADPCVSYATASTNSYVSMPASTCGGPQIWFNGANITRTTQNVVVGQPITLTTMPPPQAGQTQSWGGIPLNAIVGGFSVSPTCPTNPLPAGTPPPQCKGTVTTLSSSQFASPSTPVFYWTVPGTYVVEYQVTLGDGTTQAEYATFVVTAPTNPAFTFAGGRVKTVNSGQALKLTGIQLAPSATMPPGWENCLGATSSPNCSFLWVQLISEDELKYLFSSKVCSVPTGVLDNFYPYPSGSNGAVVDAPQVTLLLLPNEAVNWTFKANMYLMWKPQSISNSIPVPLGYVPWEVSASAVSGGAGWRIINNNYLLSFPPNLQGGEPNPQYPEWTNVIVNGPSVLKCHF
jgi:hypothetical protein